MQKRIFLLLGLLLPLAVLAQFSDDFSDGDFTQNPQWVGDAHKFSVEENILRLVDNAAGQAALATRSQLMDNTRWEFWVRLAFTPSSNNHPKIYLVSDSGDLHGGLNGYFLQIGKDGGDNKRLFFYRQDGEQVTELLAGSMNLAATTNNILRIRVLRDADGNWEFWADPLGGELFLPQGTVTDRVHTATSWFGISCRYTVSNSNRFYFDDFFAGAWEADDAPPVVEEVQVVSASSIRLFFDEVVEAASSESTANYVVDGGVGSPVIASRDPVTPNVVTLLFAEPFDANREYVLRISQVSDLRGNVMDPFEVVFVYFVPQAFDVVFNELMADPTPEVGLPPHEYIELYNTTPFHVNLEGWVLQHGTTQRQLPFAPLPAGGYLLLVTEAAYPHLRDFGHAVAVPGLSQTALTNAGTDLVLFDPDLNVVSFVSYRDTWYRDPARSNGGWSLEKIDPLNFCQGAENWRASTDPRGGTPGEPNAVLGENPDGTRPALLMAGMVNDRTVLLTFSETMDRESLANTGHYTVDQGVGQPVSAEPLLPDFSRVLLRFAQPVQPGMVYQLSLDASIADCAGNLIDKRTTRIALPEQPGPFDLVINEVLFNPPDGGSRYIEVYNRSSKVVDLKDCLLASMDTLEGILTTIQPILEESFLFFPGDYAVLTQSPEQVSSTYMTPNPGAFIRMGGMPRMTNANGILVLVTKSLEVIDRFVYEEDMHIALLTTYKGVALERVNPNLPTQDRSNWHSAAQSAGFGTPGYLNSQYSADIAAGNGEVVVEPELFSPDGDGQDDLLQIAYAFDAPGFVANVTVFDSRGRRIRRLRAGELLATSGVIAWDGVGDDGLKAPVGIYLIHVEVFDLNGNVRHFRRSAVLAGRL